MDFNTGTEYPDSVEKSSEDPNAIQSSALHFGHMAVVGIPPQLQVYVKLRFAALASICLLMTSRVSAGEAGFVPLFNGKTLDGWKAAAKVGGSNWGNFTVNPEEKAIHVYAGEKQGSEQIHNYLYTEKEFSDFILKLEYKWGENRFAPRADWDRDAGLLFHIHGDLTKIWPHCFEMQIGESPGVTAEGRDRFHTGDLFVLGEHLRAVRSEKNGFYHPDGNPKTGMDLPTTLGVEKPIGQWNEIEIQIEGGRKATFLLNREVVLKISDMEQKAGDSYILLQKGRIGLQAESAEVLYRNIRVKELRGK